MKSTCVLIMIAFLISNLWIRTHIDAAPTNTFNVDVSTDSIDANPGDGTCADSSGDCSLRAAIMEANALAGADTIVLPAGTYQLTLSGANEDNANTGDLDIANDVTISGAGSATTIIHAATLNDRAFHILTNAHATLSGATIRHAATTGDGGGILNAGTFTLTNSAVFSNTAAINGGGIFNDGVLVLDNTSVTFNLAESGGGIDNSDTITVTDSSINFNHASYAGGIQNRSSGALRVVDSSVNSNIADIDGGGILNDDDGLFILVGSTVSSNTATAYGGGISVYFGSVTLNNSSIAFNIADSGGGIDNSSQITLTNSSVILNNADYAAGIDNRFDSRTLLIDSTVTGNIAGSDGGGVLIEDDGTLILTSSTVSGNSADLNGGGIGMYAGTFTMTNSTISGNDANDDGGGIYIQSGMLTAYNATIASNRASDDGSTGDGGGIKRIGGSVILRNTILAQNVRINGVSMIDDDCNGALSQLIYSLIETTTGCTFGNSNSLTGQDPLIELLADNDGSTQTHALQANSPAIDRGDSNGCKDSSNNNLSSDQRGQLRPADGDLNGVSRCDIGAYELNHTGAYLPLILR